MKSLRIVASLLCFGLAIGLVSAQPVTPAFDSIPGKASPKQIAAFKAGLSEFLKSYPIGGAQLSSVVKALVLADPAVVDDLIGQARDGNALQKSAIGSGLGQAVRAIASVDRALADEIARKVAGSGLADLFAGYSAGQGDVLTLATTATSAVPSSSTGFVSSFGTAIPSNFFGASGRIARSSEPGSFFTVNLTQQNQRPHYGGASVSCLVSVSPRRQC